MKKTFLPTVFISVAIFLICGAGIYTYTHRASTSSPEVKGQQGYIIKKDIVYYRTTMDISNGADRYYTEVNDAEIKDADARSLVILDPYWAKDKSNLFYTGQIVTPEKDTPVADLASFTLLEGLQGMGKDNHAVYVASPHEAGWTYKAIPEADPATFTLVENGSYAKDKNNAYYLDFPFEVKKIEGALGSSFVVLGQCAAVEVSRAYYAWDSKSVIAGDKVLFGADRDTFKIVASFDNGPDGMYVAGTYAVDKNHVYKNCGEITKGNPSMCSSNNLKACE